VVQFSSTVGAIGKELTSNLVATIAITSPIVPYLNLFDPNFELEDVGVIFVVAATNNTRITTRKKWTK